LGRPRTTVSLSTKRSWVPSHRIVSAASWGASIGRWPVFRGLSRRERPPCRQYKEILCVRKPTSGVKLRKKWASGEEKTAKRTKIQTKKHKTDAHIEGEESDAAAGEAPGKKFASTTPARGGATSARGRRCGRLLREQLRRDAGRVDGKERRQRDAKNATSSGRRHDPQRVLTGKHRTRKKGRQRE